MDKVHLKIDKQLLEREYLHLKVAMKLNSLDRAAWYIRTTLRYVIRGV